MLDAGETAAAINDKRVDTWLRGGIDCWLRVRVAKKDL